MRTHTINVGTKILHDGEVAEVLAWLTPDKLQIITKNKKHLVIAPDQIDLVIDHDLLNHSLQAADSDLSQFSEKQILDAQRKHDIISKYIDGEYFKNPPVEKIAIDLSLSVSRTYKLLEKFKNGNLTSLISEVRGRKSGTKLLPNKIESIIQEAIKSNTGPSSTITKIVNSVCAMCASANQLAPSRKAIAARVKEKSEKVNSKRIYGTKKTNQDFQIRGNKYTSSHALELVQIDHCIVDVIIVDSEFRQPLGRPWLTLAIDVHTRCVLGFYLTMDHPSALSIALCMLHAVAPKNAWLQSLNLQYIQYPMYGLPQRIHVDNGKDFRSNAFISGCKEYNIKLTWRPPATPHHGAHIERLIGTLMRNMRGLPGATLSSVADKKRYTNIEAPGMTLAELRDWLTEQIGIYHMQTHSEIDCAPIYKWEKSLRNKKGEIIPPPIIVDLRKFFIDFLPFKRLTLQRGGIKINNIEYYSNALKRYSIKTTCVVKYNPASIKMVWVKPEGESQYIECPYADIRFPDTSLAEFNFTRKALAKNSASRVPATDVFAAIERNHQRVSTASVLTKKAKLAKEKRIHATAPSTSVLQGPKQALEVDYSRPAKTYNVE